MASSDTHYVIDPKEPTIVATRVFDAPRRMVFEAMTRPEAVARWYGPYGYTVPSAQIDLRPGGSYRFVNRAPDGEEAVFRGVFREVVSPERLVYTWIYEGEPNKEMVVTDVLEEHDGKTTYTSTTRCPSIEDRDALVQAGANEGGAQSMDRLAELLAEWTGASAPQPSP